MSPSRTRGRKMLVAGACGMAVLAAGGLAWAVIPAADGSITACYGKPGDALRVVDSAASCKSNEKSLTWNAQGIRGPQGLQGIQGVQGIQGIQGPEGPAGASSHGGQVGLNGGSTTSCGSVLLGSTPITIDEPSLVHVEGQVVGSATVGGRAVSLSASLDYAGGGFVGQMGSVQVPIPAGGSSLSVLAGYITAFGSGAYTVPPGDYVLSLSANAGLLCDASVMEFATGPARLVWFTAHP